MTSIRLPYVQEYRDRHGKVRRYFRRPGYKRVALPGTPGSPLRTEQRHDAALGHAELDPLQGGNPLVVFDRDALDLEHRLSVRPGKSEIILTDDRDNNFLNSAINDVAPRRRPALRQRLASV